MAEFVTLSVRFDTATLGHAFGWWTAIARQSPLIANVFTAAVAAMLLFSGPRLHGDLAELKEHLQQPYRLRPLFVAAHVGTFAGFFWLTAWLFEGDYYLFLGGPLFFGWIALGIALLGTWAASLAPPAALWGMLNRRLRPIVIGVSIGVLAWMAGQLAREMWLPLGGWTFATVRSLLQIATDDVVCSPGDGVLGTSVFSVRIDKACSGYEGIGLIWVFLGSYLWFYRKTFRFPSAFLLLPICTAVIWFANAARILLLIALGTWISADIALGGFHSQAGWLAFNAVALGSVALTRRFGWFAAATETPTTFGHLRPTAAYLAPFLVIVAVAMATAAFSRPGEPDWLYPIRVLAAVATLWFFRAAYTGFNGTRSWRANGIGMGIGVLAAAVWIASAAICSGTAASSPLPPMTAGVPSFFAIAWFFFRVAGYVVAVPIAEELAFRGYLTRRIISSDPHGVPLGQFSWLSFLGSSVLFGILHGRYWLGGILSGMLFAGALYRRKRLADAVLAHATTNATIAAYASLTGNWHLWS